MRPDVAAIRAQLIASLQQRATTLHGEARRLLDARLADLRALDADVQDEARNAPSQAHAPGPLRQLADQLAHDAPTDRTAYPELPALADFRQLWSTLRADSQLQQTVAHTPTDAGPLNSAALASRAIALMRETSPGYLRAFLAYVDDLAWLEQLGTAGTATPMTAPKKRATRKPRR
ncbi:DUF2894 domain-containing protein [Dyella sp. KULCS107]|uniref:DUF2894 domain-containing protein n=1 Tax=Dyella sp. KULCS107 TaxID=3422216 RepID=UPI003D6E7CCD